MHISQRGIELICSFEGFSPSIYLCPGKCKTIGFGHVLRNGEEELYKHGITRQKARDLLAQDIAECEKIVLSLIRVEITQNQFDALVSFVFNVGIKNFKNSTLLKRVNQEKHELVGIEFMKWNRAGGTISNGLVHRRNAERELYIQAMV